jgi:RTX calcium-binding nonapeptide repeat (4 copies)
MRDRRLERIRRWSVGFAVLVFAVLLASGAGARLRPMAGGDPTPPNTTPPPEPKQCPTPTKNLAPVRNARGQAHFPDALCGTTKKDSFKAAGGGDSIWGFQQQDTIDARNKGPDEIWGGPGRDIIYADSCDKIYSDYGARDRVVKKGDCPDVVKSHYRAGASLDYPAYLATMECLRDPTNGVFVIRFIEQPTMLAVDATPQVDWQTVAWSGALFEWNGTDWQYDISTQWRWDRAPDAQDGDFLWNVWRLVSTGKPSFVHFEITKPGIYRVAVIAHWYKSDNVPAHDLAFWAGPHYGPYEQVGQEACDFTKP